METDKFIEDLKDYRDVNRKNLSYSVQRLDILVVSLSTTSIVLVVSYLRWLIDSPIDKTLPGILGVVSIIFFAVSLLLNFASQFTSYKSHKIELEITKFKLYKMSYFGNYDEAEYSELEKNSDCHDKLTQVYSTISRIGLFVGVLSIIVSLSVVFVAYFL